MSSFEEKIVGRLNKFNSKFISQDDKITELQRTITMLRQKPSATSSYDNDNIIPYIASGTVWKGQPLCRLGWNTTYKCVIGGKAAFDEDDCFGIAIDDVADGEPGFAISGPVVMARIAKYNDASSPSAGVRVGTVVNSTYLSPEMDNYGTLLTNRIEGTDSIGYGWVYVNYQDGVLCKLIDNIDADATGTVQRCNVAKAGYGATFEATNMGPGDGKIDDPAVVRRYNGSPFFSGLRV